MTKTEKLIDVLTSEHKVDVDEARELLRHYYYGMTQVIREMEITRDEMFERWATEADTE